jgi:hypothetical protein
LPILQEERSLENVDLKEDMVSILEDMKDTVSVVDLEVDMNSMAGPDLVEVTGTAVDGLQQSLGMTHMQLTHIYTVIPQKSHMTHTYTVSSHTVITLGMNDSAEGIEALNTVSVEDMKDMKVVASILEDMKAVIEAVKAVVTEASILEAEIQVVITVHLEAAVSILEQEAIQAVHMKAPTQHKVEKPISRQPITLLIQIGVK